MIKKNVLPRSREGERARCSGTKNIPLEPEALGSHITPVFNSQLAFAQFPHSVKIG